MTRSLGWLALMLAGTAAAQTPQTADGFAPGPEQALVARTCTACHDASTVTGQHKTPADWQATVEQMIDMGAQVPPGQKDAIVAYLARHYPAK